MRLPGSRAAKVHRITGAQRSHSDDLDARISRYLMSMAVRTVCVVLAVLVDGPWRWVFAAGALGLPYLAVVMANAGGERRLADPPPPGPRAPRSPPADLPADPPPGPAEAPTPGPTQNPHNGADHEMSRTVEDGVNRSPGTWNASP